MVVDAGPHLLSVLQTLLGPGTLRDIHTEFQDLPELGANAKGLIILNYIHGKGETQVAFKLSRCLEAPRPAGYEINGAFVERHIELRNYMISFENEGERVPVRDPLAVCVEHFVDAMRTRRQPDRTSLVDGMTQLHELVAAAISREQ